MVAIDFSRIMNFDLNSDRLDMEWHELHAALGNVLSRFGIEDPFGEGDYWIVDDNWGDPSHKVCISRESFVTPELLSTIQQAMAGYPAWRVLLQIDEALGRAAGSATGYTVRADQIEFVGAAPSKDGAN